MVFSLYLLSIATRLYSAGSWIKLVVEGRRHPSAWDYLMHVLLALLKESPIAIQR